MEKISEYRLTKWRRLLLLRDCATTGECNGKPVRSPWCAMCNTSHYGWRLQAHHIRPKSEYPELALELSNGIMLCLRCHMAITHGGNSFKDMQGGIAQWKFMRPAFDRYVGLKKARKFNEQNQHRI